LVQSIEGEAPSPDFVASLRQQIVAETATPQVVTDAEPVFELDLRPESEERPMAPKRWIVAGLAAAAIALIVGFVALSGDGDDGGLDTVDTPQEPTTTIAASTTTAAPATIQEPVPASGECGLAVTPTVAARGDSVTFEVTSDPGCEGETVRLSATPAAQGIPIQKNLTLDADGVQYVSDQLGGSRKAEQSWTVELTLSDRDDVAAVGGFAVTGFCDLEGSADLQVTYLPDTNEVTIVLTVDPLCAGSVLTFTPEVIGGPQGGWDRFTVDETSRIEITRPVLAPGPIITIDAIEAGGGATGLTIASVTLDISG